MGGQPEDFLSVELDFGGKALASVSFLERVEMTND